MYFIGRERQKTFAQIHINSVVLASVEDHCGIFDFLFDGRWKLSGQGHTSTYSFIKMGRSIKIWNEPMGIRQSNAC